ncbi:hypothetical protein D3C81_1956990 [compost metagenome]
MEMEWSGGRLVRANIRSIAGGRVTVVYGERRIELDFSEPGFEVQLSAGDWE